MGVRRTSSGRGSTCWIASTTSRTPRLRQRRESSSRSTRNPFTSCTELTTTATPDGDGFRVTGQKIFTTHGLHATVFLVYVRYGPGTGNIGSVLIKGDVVGIDVFDSGQVSATGNIGSITVGGSVLGGSGGGLPQGLAALLASHGYVALALAYFSYEHLPAELVSIPLEYFETGMRWLQGNSLEVASLKALYASGMGLWEAFWTNRRPGRYPQPSQN